MSENSSETISDALLCHAENISVETSHTLLPIVLDVITQLYPDMNREGVMRSLEFMVSELNGHCEGLSDGDRLHVLNHHFFDEKGFSFVTLSGQDDRSLMMDHALQTRRGHGQLMSLFYLYLAGQLNIPVDIIDWPSHFVLKWTHSGQCQYIDLGRRGAGLTEQELLTKLNEEVPSHLTPCVLQNRPCFEIKPARLLLTDYLSTLIEVYESSQQNRRLRICLDLFLQIEPHDFKMLLKRVYLRRHVGLTREALEDLKRYFSFNELNQAPKELRKIYFELDSLHANEHSPNLELLH